MLVHFFYVMIVLKTKISCARKYLKKKKCIWKICFKKKEKKWNPLPHFFLPCLCSTRISTEKPSPERRRNPPHEAAILSHPASNLRADGNVSVGDPFYSEEQQVQQQLPFTKGKYNMGFPCTPIHLINYASACV